MIHKVEFSSRVEKYKMGAPYFLSCFLKHAGACGSLRGVTQSMSLKSFGESFFQPISALDIYLAECYTGKNSF